MTRNGRRVTWRRDVHEWIKEEMKEQSSKEYEDGKFPK